LPTFDERRKSIIALSSVSCRRGSTIFDARHEQCPAVQDGGHSSKE
jgi:hypothetical protein